MKNTSEVTSEKIIEVASRKINSDEILREDFSRASKCNTLWGITF